MNQDLTELVVVLDRSGSMSSCAAMDEKDRPGLVTVLIVTGGGVYHQADD